MTGISENRQKKIAVVNDLSGYGRCALTVAIPVISALGIQCCPVPTSILSNHTGFFTYFFDDYTSKMVPYLEEWKKLDLGFDGIYTGFLGSEEQIDIVAGMIRDFGGKRTKIIIDPIMGDNGKPYQTYTPQMCQRMRELVTLGNIVTPNLTEGCILTGRDYKNTGWSRQELTDIGGEIVAMGPDTVIMTGIRQGNFIANLVLERGKEAVFVRTRKVGRPRPGTGDIFSSIVAAMAVKGTEVKEAVKTAAWFVRECILESEALKEPVENGVCFEQVLPRLMKRK